MALTPAPPLIVIVLSGACVGHCCRCVRLDVWLFGCLVVWLFAGSLLSRVCQLWAQVVAAGGAATLLLW